MCRVPCRLLLGGRARGQERFAALDSIGHEPFRLPVVYLGPETAETIVVPAWMDHFDLELYDILYDITKQLRIEEQVCCSSRFEGITSLRASEALRKSGLAAFGRLFVVRHLNLNSHDFFPLCDFSESLILCRSCLTTDGLSLTVPRPSFTDATSRWPPRLLP